jgi:LytS/YehU family sensor histidine kinase
VFLGTSPAILAIGVVYLSAFAGALRAASQASAQLYAFGQHESARVARAESQLSDARLAALQAQMNPHFLFNALNTVAALVRTDPGAAETTVENLAEVLRSTLQRSQQTLGTVRDEVEFVRAYLAIERQRFGERLSVDWTVDPAALDICLPPLTVQPLVENALKHGIGQRRDGGRIVVSVVGMAERLRIEVADNGDGLDRPLHEGTGLRNLRDRLRVLYGSAGTLSLESSAAGTRVRVEVPLTTPGASDARADR